jgi:hypothetical protein
MSTRCQIGFYGKGEKDLKKFQALLYKHSDGYPEGVLPIIEPFLKEFNAKRGLSDIEYASAWCLYTIIQDHVTHMAEWAKDSPSPSCPEDGRDFLGHGICTGFHGDIEYFYAVQPDTLTVYEVRDEDPKTWKKIKTIRLTDKVPANSKKLTDAQGKALRPDVLVQTK